MLTNVTPIHLVFKNGHGPEYARSKRSNTFKSPSLLVSTANLIPLLVATSGIAAPRQWLCTHKQISLHFWVPSCFYTNACRLSLRSGPSFSLTNYTPRSICHLQSPQTRPLSRPACPVLEDCGGSHFLLAPTSHLSLREDLKRTVSPASGE